MKTIYLFIIMMFSLNSFAVMNGKEDTDGKFQNIVSISGISLCTGTVISPYIILTAAHCVHDGRVPLEIKSFATGQSIKPAKVIPHPTAKFNDTQSKLLKGEDIALVILEEPVQIPTDAFLPLVKRNEIKIKEGIELDIVGIGVDESGWPYRRPKVSKAEIVDIPYWKCGGNAKKTFSTKDVVRVGDSGGAAFSKTSDGQIVQVGVTSSRMIFDWENEYLPPEEQKEVDCENKSIFMDVKKYLRWIKKSTGYEPQKSHQDISQGVLERFDINNVEVGTSTNCARNSLLYSHNLDLFVSQLENIVNKLEKKCSIEIQIASSVLNQLEITKHVSNKQYTINKEIQSSSYLLEITEEKNNVSLRLKNSRGDSLYSSTVTRKLFKQNIGVKNFMNNLPFCRR